VRLKKKRNKRTGGPQTELGKAIASKNSETHGAFALKRPDTDDYYAFAERVQRELRPTGPLQHEVVDSAAFDSYKSIKLREIERRNLLRAEQEPVDRLVSVKGAPVTDARGRVCTPTLLECKTASAFNSDQWGQSWTDQVPAAYLAQCIWYTTITGCEEAHIAVLLGNSDFRVYRVAHDEELGQGLIDAAITFWDRHVLTGVAPEPHNRAEVARIYPKEVRGKEVQADGQTLAQLKKLSQIQRLAKKLEARSDLIKDQLTASMGDAERLCAKGKTIATWRSCAPTQRLDVTRLRRERPDLLKEYVVETPATRRLVLAGASGLEVINSGVVND
jgi:predicted phage-related endonuclease